MLRPGHKTKADEQLHSKLHNFASYFYKKKNIPCNLNGNLFYGYGHNLDATLSRRSR